MPLVSHCVWCNLLGKIFRTVSGILFGYYPTYFIMIARSCTTLFYFLWLFGSNKWGRLIFLAIHNKYLFTGEIQLLDKTFFTLFEKIKKGQVNYNLKYFGQLVISRECRKILLRMD